MTEPARRSSPTDPKTGTRMELREIFEAYYPSICRLLRRLGVHPPQIDDAAQEVFWVAARRLSDIAPGREHSFLYGVALRVAANEVRRRSSALPIVNLQEIPLLPDERPSAEEQLAERQARELLDEALDQLPADLRAVLVLHEIEGLEVKQIAEIESVPVGTASSRLRRAREELSVIARRIRARLQSPGRHD